ncbi:MAG: hypothetical protein RLP14_05790 [Owenweeksia sp.]
MKTIITLTLATFISSLSWASGPDKSGDKVAEPAFIGYDAAKGSWEQPNPVFRWPLPAVKGEVYVNVQFVWLGESLVQESALNETRAYLNDVYNAHGIYISYNPLETEKEMNKDQLIQDWKEMLPAKKGQLTVYVLPFEGTELERRDLYSTNQIVSNRALVPFQDEQEFKVFVAKNLGHMLGLLPTYFENPVYGVNSEDGDNCGNAGDFVCDTPFDYLGLRNDVKKRSCRYKGKVGDPDAGNIMANSWTECMDHITPEQANKIKYNLSVIPALQSTLDTKSTIALNIDALSFKSQDKASLE